MDMGDLIGKGFDYIVSGGTKGVVALLISIIVALVWDRKRLQDSLEKKDGKIQEIIDNYHKGNMTMVEAFAGLKILLSEIKSKL